MASIPDYSKDKSEDEVIEVSPENEIDELTKLIG